MPVRLLIPLLLLWPLLAGAACTRPLRVPFEDWRPYSFVSAGGHHTGLETEILAAVAHELGCEVEYVNGLPRNRRLPMLAAGELDLLLAASYDGPNSPEIAWYTRPYRDEEFAAFVPANTRRRTDIYTLTQLLQLQSRLLTHRGPSVAPIVEQFAAKGLVTPFEDYAKGLQLLKLGRGDFIIGDRLALLAAAEDAKVPLVELPAYVRRDVVAYKLSRKNFTEADVEAFNQAILHLEATGELQRIRARWLPGRRR